jgi:uncharacterized protein YbaA (DUF1428 family)
MPYVDGFALPISKRKLPEYRRIARKAGKMFKEHGALEYWECTGDDMAPGVGRTFPRAANAKKGETVIFSWILYKSRAHRDRVNKKVMHDPRMAEFVPKKMPFNIRRMIWGGFKPLVTL